MNPICMFQTWVPWQELPEANSRTKPYHWLPFFQWDSVMADKSYLLPTPCLCYCLICTHAMYWGKVSSCCLSAAAKQPLLQLGGTGGDDGAGPEQEWMAPPQTLFPSHTLMLLLAHLFLQALIPCDSSNTKHPGGSFFGSPYPGEDPLVLGTVPPEDSLHHKGLFLFFNLTSSKTHVVREIKYKYCKNTFKF